MSLIDKQFGLKDRVAVILAGGGVLGSALAVGLAEAGAKVIVGDIDLAKAQKVAKDIEGKGLSSQAMKVDALDRQSLESACQGILDDYGQIDILISAAGGNIPSATTSSAVSFFDLPIVALEKVIDLNLLGGAILPAQVFGRRMVENPNGGAILFVSSMCSLRPLTCVAGYSAAKAALSNFTQWLAVHVAQNYSPKLRVNALAPGFFLTEQNRYLLLEKDAKTLTSRGEQVKNHTPMGRFGDPSDLIGTTIWLVSDAARFVTGTIIPVDGGFSAYSGV